jgi:hypothetical protein
MAEPRYETAYEQQQRTGHTDSVVCADCGVFVMDVAVHTRFHSILSGAGVIAGHEEKISGEDPYREYQDALSAHDRSLSELARTGRMVDRARDAYRRHIGELPVTGDT